MAVQVIMNQQAGPLPIKVQFNAPSDGPACVVAAGSVWSTAANEMVGIEVSIDGKPVGSASVFSNLQSTHRSVVPSYIPVTLAFGQHTLVLSASTKGTVTDHNDFFTVILNF
jgi:hypothetical protein